MNPFSGLTEIERRAIATLRELGEVRCSTLGSRLWGGGRGRSSNPFTRQAGSVMARLKKRGLVVETWPIGAKATHWKLTEEGRRT